MKGSIAASAALVASVAAAAHNGHHAAHLRRHFNTPEAKVCTVYTTVYAYPSEIPSVPAVPEVHSTVEYPVVESSSIVEYPSESTPVVEYSSYPVESPSTSCTESKTSETPVVVISTTPVESPSTSCTESKTSETPAAPSTPAKDEGSYIPGEESHPPAGPSKEEVYPEVPTSTKEVPAPPKETYTPPKENTPEVEKPKPSPSKKAHKPKPSKPATIPGSYDSTGRIVTKGDKWAITYTPYTDSGECRSAEEVKRDIANIAKLGFTTIRSYSTDCGVFENVVPECEKHGLKVIYGIFLEAGGAGGKGPHSEYANSQLTAIIKGAPKDSIALLIVGNEALFNGYCTAEELASYITYVKQQLKSAGFPEDIAVTTTEPVGTWQEKGAALCSVIDVFAVQIHPYFTSKVDASNAGSFAREQLELAASVCPDAAGKGKYITEIGWPKAGNNNGAAQPGVYQQKIAIKDILKEVGKESCLFSYGDDHWKNPGEFGVEQSFGCLDALA